MLATTSYEEISSKTCWICFNALLATEDTTRMSTGGHRFRLHSLLVHVHNVPGMICLVCHTLTDEASLPARDAANMVQEFSRALQTSRNSLQFYRSQKRWLCCAKDMVANSIPETSAVLACTQRECTVLNTSATCHTEEKLETH